jgi:hypothetical protein
MDNDDNNNDNENLLPMSLIHYIFDTYFGIGFKRLIHKEGSTDEDRSKVLSIELIMLSQLNKLNSQSNRREMHF